MTIPVAVLLGFAAWTLRTLFGSVGVYRRRRILGGEESIAVWRADLLQGSGWYQRAMRARMDCVENLFVYTVIVIALVASGVRRPVIDRLALLAARIVHATVHIALPSTPVTASLRFALFFQQIICTIAMGMMTAVPATP